MVSIRDRTPAFAIAPLKLRFPVYITWYAEVRVRDIFHIFALGMLLHTDLKVPLGTGLFAHKTIRSLELSHSGPFAPTTEYSKELILRYTKRTSVTHNER